jgi:hypothetical protein
LNCLHEHDHDSDAGSQLWGIYYTDREYAREIGDPLRTVIEAPTKLAARKLQCGLASRSVGASRLC